MLANIFYGVFQTFIFWHVHLNPKVKYFILGIISSCVVTAYKTEILTFIEGLLK